MRRNGAKGEVPGRAAEARTSSGVVREMRPETVAKTDTNWRTAKALICICYSVWDARYHVLCLANSYASFYSQINYNLLCEAFSDLNPFLNSLNPCLPPAFCHSSHTMHCNLSVLLFLLH